RPGAPRRGRPGLRGPAVAEHLELDEPIDLAGGERGLVEFDAVLLDPVCGDADHRRDPGATLAGAPGGVNVAAPAGGEGRGSRRGGWRRSGSPTGGTSRCWSRPGRPGRRSASPSGRGSRTWWTASRCRTGSPTRTPTSPSGDSDRNPAAPGPRRWRPRASPGNSRRAWTRSASGTSGPAAGTGRPEDRASDPPRPARAGAGHSASPGRGGQGPPGPDRRGGRAPRSAPSAERLVHLPDHLGSRVDQGLVPLVLPLRGADL